MDMRDTNISIGCKIRRLIFETRSKKTNLSLVLFLGMVFQFPSAFFTTAVQIYPVPAAVLTTSCSFSPSSQPENENVLPARRKPLIVRVVRKALRAGSFLTTLPLHPKNMLLSKTIFWFSAGGLRYEKAAYPSRKIGGQCVC